MRSYRDGHLPDTKPIEIDPSPNLKPIKLLAELRGWSVEALLRLQVQAGGANDCEVHFPMFNCWHLPVGLRRRRADGQKILVGKKVYRKASTKTGGRNGLFLSTPFNKDGPVLITEGEADAVAAMSKGWDGKVIGTPGACISVECRNSLWSLLVKRDVILAPDPDSAGMTWLETVGEVLTTAAKARVSVIPPQKGLDLDKRLADGEALEAILATAQPWSPQPKVPKPARKPVQRRARSTIASLGDSSPLQDDPSSVITYGWPKGTTRQLFLSQGARLWPLAVKHCGSPEAAREALRKAAGEGVDDETLQDRIEVINNLKDPEGPKKPKAMTIDPGIQVEFPKAENAQPRQGCWISNNRRREEFERYLANGWPTGQTQALFLGRGRGDIWKYVLVKYGSAEAAREALRRVAPLGVDEQRVAERLQMIDGLEAPRGWKDAVSWQKSSLIATPTRVEGLPIDLLVEKYFKYMLSNCIKPRLAKRVAQTATKILEWIAMGGGKADIGEKRVQTLPWCHSSRTASKHLAILKRSCPLIKPVMRWDRELSNDGGTIIKGGVYYDKERGLTIRFRLSEDFAKALLSNAATSTGVALVSATRSPVLPLFPLHHLPSPMVNDEFTFEPEAPFPGNHQVTESKQPCDLEIDPLPQPDYAYPPSWNEVRPDKIEPNPEDEDREEIYETLAECGVNLFE